jgi:hypothetical protein
MVKSNSNWRGQDWQDEKPLWDQSHPIYQRVQPVIQAVETEFAEAFIKVPNIDSELRAIIASFGVMYSGQFYRAQRTMPAIALEAVAYLYTVGGTHEAWRDYLEKLAVKISPQSQNDFITFLRLVCGSRPDPTRRLGRTAAALHIWSVIYRPGPAVFGDEQSEDWGWTDPQLVDDKPGSSDFCKWLKQENGYSRIAERGLKHYAQLVIRNEFTPTPATPEPEPAARVAPGKPSQDASAPTPVEGGNQNYSESVTQPPPAESSWDGSSDDELSEEEQREELEGNLKLIRLFINKVRQDGGAIRIIGCVSGKGELGGELMPPDDPRAQSWLIQFHENGKWFTYGDLAWQTRQTAEAFAKEHGGDNYSENYSDLEPPTPEAGGRSGSASPDVDPSGETAPVEAAPNAKPSFKSEPGKLVFVTNPGGTERIYVTREAAERDGV